MNPIRNNRINYEGSMCNCFDPGRDFARAGNVMTAISTHTKRQKANKCEFVARKGEKPRKSITKSFRFIVKMLHGKNFS